MLKKLLLTFLLTLSLVLTTTLPAVAASDTYQIQPGDTLYLIAQRFGTTVQSLREANGIWGDLIYPGEVIYIPTTPGERVHIVKWGETLWLIAGYYGTTVAALQKTNGLWSTEIYPGQQLIIPGTSTPTAPGYTDNLARQIDLLARMIHAEAEAEPYVGKVAVGAVILNRVRDPRFPNTISGVLFQPGEFEPLLNNRFWEITPSAESYEAAWDALAGWDPTGGAIFFYNPLKSKSYWIFTRTVTNQIGQHVFAI